MTDTVLRLRADAYYVPVPDGVWIRTTDNSFTLSGRTVATWVEKLAPLLDRGVLPEELLGALRPDQTAFVDQLLKILEQRNVLRWERADDPAAASPLARLLPQQAEYLRHFTADPEQGLDRVRRHPLAVAGPADRAETLATTLLEAGFGDILLLDAQPGGELLDVASEFAGHGVPVSLSGGPGDLAGRTLVGVFPPGDEGEAWALLERAESAGCGAWFGLVSGQAMLLKGQLPRSGSACVRCAWRRLAHHAVALPGSDGLGHVPVSVSAAVLAQELFQYIATGDAGVLDEGVVVDLTRLSIWRTAVDPDPGCPGHAVHTEAASAGVSRAGRGRSRFPESVFGARCFGPLFSCAPEELVQFPLAALRVRFNPPGRTAPTGTADGPVVVAETVADARSEAALIAVEALLPTDGTVVGTGRDTGEALARALLRHGDVSADDAGTQEHAGPLSEQARKLARLAGIGADVRTGRRPSGLWQSRVDGITRTGFTPEQAQERALLAATAVEQLGPDEGAGSAAAWTGTIPPQRRAAEVAAALRLTWHEVGLPQLVADDLTGVVLTPERAL